MGWLWTATLLVGSAWAQEPQYERFIEAVNFSSQPDGSIGVQVRLGIASSPTTEPVDLGTDLVLTVNGVPTATTTIAADVEVGLPGFCSTGDCGSSCTIVYGSTILVGTCKSFGRGCVCATFRNWDVPGLRLVDGDVVEASLTPAVGAVEEVDTDDDSKSVTFLQAVPTDPSSWSAVKGTFGG